MHKAALPFVAGQGAIPAQENGQSECQFGDVLNSQELVPADGIGHSNHPSSLCENSTIAEAAGKGASPTPTCGQGPDLLKRYLYTWATVPGVEPVNGWTLLVRDFQDGEGAWHPEYIAIRNGWERDLYTSRFAFTPTQARFAFLIANPQRAFVGRSGVGGSWTDDAIDAAIAAEAVAA